MELWLAATQHLRQNGRPLHVRRYRGGQRDAAFSVRPNVRSATPSLFVSDARGAMNCLPTRVWRTDRNSNMKSLQQDWLANVRNDLLAGLVVALALIPEAIAFSIIAGVDPKVGLYASFSIATVIAFAGGRPGMISAATGAMALVMVTLVKEHGLQYLLVATVLTGVLQIAAGYLRLGVLMRFVSRSSPVSSMRSRS